MKFTCFIRYHTNFVYVWSFLQQDSKECRSQASVCISLMRSSCLHTHRSSLVFCLRCCCRLPMSTLRVSAVPLYSVRLVSCSSSKVTPNFSASVPKNCVASGLSDGYPSMLNCIIVSHRSCRRPSLFIDEICSYFTPCSTPRPALFALPLGRSFSFTLLSCPALGVGYRFLFCFV